MIDGVIYAPWLVKAMVKAYQEGISVALMAHTLDKPETSIRAKLVREGVYKSKTLRRQSIVAQMEEGF